MTFARVMLVFTVLMLMALSIVIGWYAATWPLR
ncbi:MAG: hypothetical protein RL245_162 [Pseudomonadota bacterium]|jgi:hypothetical protein